MDRQNFLRTTTPAQIVEKGRMTLSSVMTKEKLNRDDGGVVTGAQAVMANGS